MYFLQDDMFNREKPSVMHRIKFDGGVPVSHHKEKLETPQDLYAQVNGANVDTFATRSPAQQAILRRYDPNLKPVNERHFDSGDFWFAQPFSINFAGTSSLLALDADQTSIYLATIESDVDKAETEPIIQLDDFIGNTFWPSHIGDDTHLVNFQAEDKIGWINIQDGTVRNVFVSTGSAITCQRSSTTIHLPQQPGRLAIQKAVRLDNNSYVMSFSYLASDPNARGVEAFGFMKIPLPVASTT